MIVRVLRLRASGSSEPRWADNRLLAMRFYAWCGDDDASLLQRVVSQSEGVMVPLPQLLITNHVEAEQERARIRREREEVKRNLEKTVAESFDLLREAGAALERVSDLFHQNRSLSP